MCIYAATGRIKVSDEGLADDFYHLGMMVSLLS